LLQAGGEFVLVLLDGWLGKGEKALGVFRPEYFKQGFQ
jgi:hypothetical protein